MRTSKTGYLGQFRREFMELYEAEGIDAAANFAAEKVLESYNNGVEKGKGGRKTPKVARSSKERTMDYTE